MDNELALEEQDLSVSSVSSDDLFEEEKPTRAFRTIAEVAAELGLEQHVLRFWEKKFPELVPVKRAGDRRYYRQEDVDLLVKIKTLLHQEGYSIKGVQNLMKEGTLNATYDRVSQNVKPAQSEDSKKPANFAELDSVITELEEISALLKKVT